MTTLIKYVRHSEIEAHLADGWLVTSELTGTHHGEYAVIMEYTGDDKAVTGDDDE